jgi:hypothetical protein
MMVYEDFSIKIEPKREEGYPVVVLQSRAGEGRSSFTLPFEPEEISDVLLELGQAVKHSSRAPNHDTPHRHIGDLLFTALFSGQVRSLFDRSLSMARERQRGLRIKLHIDPQDPSLAQLASLPWEFLFRKETREFLNLSKRTPISRYLDLQRPYAPPPLEPPLRVLVVIFDPQDDAPLDLDREREKIETSWAEHQDIQVEIMERATIPALKERLAERPYHVLHYVGHADLDERTGQAVLVLEGARVDGSTLATLLRDVPTMRLVVLNAFQPARPAEERTLDPLVNVAAATVLSGIPAAVATQFPISDGAATTFARGFYPLLARSHPVDVAASEGRRSVYFAESKTMEWGAPVLFMHAPDGMLFEVPVASEPPDQFPLLRLAVIGLPVLLSLIIGFLLIKNALSVQPKEALTVTAIPAATDTPQPIAPPQPTLTDTHPPTPTSTPMSTPTPTPTASPTPTPSPVAIIIPTVIPTPTTGPRPTSPTSPKSSPTPESYPPPSLSENSILGCNVTFKWRWSGVLAEDEYFDVRVGMGSAPSGVTWTKDYQYTYGLVAAGEYVWAVAICRGTAPYCEQLAVSELASFTFWGCQSVP